MSQKYDTCKKCGKETVQLCTTGGLVFFGDQDDREGNPSEYADREVYTGITAGAHICMECEAVDDIWIEDPHQGDDTFILNWLQEQMRQEEIGLVRGVLARVRKGEDLREVVKLMREER